MFRANDARGVVMSGHEAGALTNGSGTDVNEADMNHTGNDNTISDPTREELDLASSPERFAVPLEGYGSGVFT